MLYKLTKAHDQVTAIEPMPFSGLPLEKHLENLIATSLLDVLFEGNELMPIRQERAMQPEADIVHRLAKNDIVFLYHMPKSEPLFPENTKELWMLSIAKTMRGKGIGKTLAIQLIEHYAKSHLYACCRPASKNMVGILRSMGFAELGNVPFSEDRLLFLDRGGAVGQVQERLRARQIPIKKV